jgi:hypothetical protein
MWETILAGVKGLFGKGSMQIGRNVAVTPGENAGGVVVVNGDAHFHSDSQGEKKASSLEAIT